MKKIPEVKKSKLYSTFLKTRKVFINSRKYSYRCRNIIIAAVIFLSLIFISTIAASCNAAADLNSSEMQYEDTGNKSTSIQEFDGDILVITGSTTLLEVSLGWADAFMSRYGGEVTINGGGSGEGIKALTHQTTDLANASRSIQEDEINYAIEHDVAVQENIVLVDGIAVITSSNVEIEKLSFEQLSKIYKGEIVNWSEVGSHDMEIIAAARDSISGTGEYFLENVLRLGNKNSDDYYSEKYIL
ncbi:MAG: substrate-binding domain-containing protein, partial [Actinobacteria bacterium]|nr:substrate-binding domain-containing protein [Actinomycetota bacterium]